LSESTKEQKFLSLFSFQGTLNPVPPFDFSQSLAFISDFSPMKSEQEIKNDFLTKAVEVEGRTIAFEITRIGTVENPKLRYTAYSENKFTKEIENFVADRISFFLSLQDDLKPFYEIAKKDKSFEPAIKRFYGHKQVKFLTPFEIACWAILSQRIPMTIAHKMKDQIIQKVGGHIKVKETIYGTFPEAPKLEAMGPEKLFEMVPNKRKAEYLWAVTKAFSQVDEQWLRTGPYDEVYEWLTDIKGIGEWSANFVLIRGLGRMEKLATIGPDLALDVGKIYMGKNEAATELEVCKFAEKYGRWIGYWAYYLRIYAEFAYVFEEGKKQLNTKT
jgi:DNA-3-methyladenine glycosylase II